eukprot:189056_1
MRLFWYSSVILLIRYFVLINGIPSAIISTLNGLDEQASGIPTSDSPFSWRVANAGCTNNYPIINQAITSGSRGVCLDSIVGSNAYYQVYLGALYTISSVVIQGRNNINQFVKSYNLEYSLDGITFIDNGINNPVTGNIDRYSLVFTVLDINTRFLRWIPITFNGYKSFKIEAYGEFIDTISPTPSPTVPTTSPTYPVASTFPPEERCQSNEIFHYQFILDESGSITADRFNNIIKPFTNDIIQRDINHVSDVSIIIYDNNVIELHRFDDTQQPRDEMLYKLNSRIYDNGATHTGEAMQTGINQFVAKGYNQNNIIFLLTDGATTSNTIHPCDSRIVQGLNDNGITLIVIGIGVTINQLGLQCADKTFEIPQFTQTAFTQIHDEIRDVICIDCQYYQQVCSIDANYVANIIDYNNYNNKNNDYYKGYHKGLYNATIAILLIQSIIFFCLYLSYLCLKNTQNKTKQKLFKYNSVEVSNDSDNQI